MTATAASRPDAAAPHAAHSRHFPVSTAELERISAAVLDAAKRGGATAAETDVSQGIGQSVTVRKDAVETISYNRDKGISVTVYVGQRRGNASTADFADDSIRATVDKALAIARYTAEDPASGLADPARLARELARSRPLSPVGPFGGGSGRARPRDRGRGARRRSANHATAKARPSRAANRSSCTRTRWGSPAATARSRHHIDCSVIGEPRRRDAARLLVHRPRGAVGPCARRAKSDASPASARCDGSIARKLRHDSNARCCSRRRKRPTSSASSCRRYRAAACTASRRSCSTRSGTQVFAPHVRLREEPHLLRARGSAPFDSEGVATKPRDVVRDGVVQGYFLGSYSARKLGMESTGNGGGSHNLVLVAWRRRPAGAAARAWAAGSSSPSSWGRASTPSPATSRAAPPASGSRTASSPIRWRRSPSPATCATCSRDIVAVGNDVDRRGSRHTGSILIDRMTIAGH